MFLVELCPVDHARNQAALPVRVFFSMAAVKRVLMELSKNLDGSMVIECSGHTEADVNVPVTLRWSKRLGGFACAAGGVNAGVILLDEIAGAANCEATDAQSVQPCRVRLRGSVDVWRRGLIDLITGEVFVYTATEKLALGGATVFAGDLCVELEAGEPALSALPIPSIHLSGVRKLLGFEELESSLSNANDAIMQNLSSALSVAEDFFSAIA